MDREVEARKWDHQARTASQNMGRAAMLLAEAACKVRELKLYRELGFNSFPEWAEAVSDVGRSYAHALADDWGKFQEVAPREDLVQMTVANARDLTKIPERKRTREVIDGAKQMNNRTFRELANKVVPGIALEQRTSKTFQLDASLYKRLEEVLAWAKETAGVETDAGALEFILEDVVGGQENSARYRAARDVYEAGTHAIDPDDPTAPPFRNEWAMVLVALNELGKAFKFKKPTVAQVRAQRATAGARVQ